MGSPAAGVVHRIGTQVGDILVAVNPFEVSNPSTSKQRNKSTAHLSVAKQMLAAMCGTPYSRDLLNRDRFRKIEKSG